MLRLQHGPCGLPDQMAGTVPLPFGYGTARCSQHALRVLRRHRAVAQRARRPANPAPRVQQDEVRQGEMAWNAPGMNTKSTESNFIGMPACVGHGREERFGNTLSHYNKFCGADAVDQSTRPAFFCYFSNKQHYASGILPANNFWRLTPAGMRSRRRLITAGTEKKRDAPETPDTKNPHR